MKTNRKYLARSFTKIAKRWEDSKKTTENLRKHGYKNARQWGREMANMYFEDVACNMAADALAEMLEEAALCDTPITQDDFDYFAFEEISSW
jgi:hypothetical protein